MEFKRFKECLQENFNANMQDAKALFTVNVDKDALWNAYLDAFPPGTNNVYRERREYDCGCCKQFIRAFGNVVTIKDNKLVTIWDFRTGDSTFDAVTKTLEEFIRNAAVDNVFCTKERSFGTDKNHESLPDSTVVTWEHFFLVLPKKFVIKSPKSVESIMGELRSSKEVFKRSLDEISLSAIEVVIDLIAQNSLYKGEEWAPVLGKFLELHREYGNLPEEEKDLHCWDKSMAVGPVISRIKNHSIGTLLMNISEGMELDEAVRKYEGIVAPSNYKRPKAIFTKKMVEQAEKTIADLGFTDSLSRRLATLDDISINNILFANKDAAKRIAGSVFDKLKESTAQNLRSFDKVEEIGIEDFVSYVLPTASALEVLVENRHTENLVSLIAPTVKDSKSMFKWGNNFSWAYKGNITDSMKENVKAAGGNVDGVLRFSIQWNDNGDNQNDFDAHCKEPSDNRRGDIGDHIYYGNKGIVHRSSGKLDVDIISPGSRVAVENIIYTDKRRMPNGVYEFFVHVFSFSGGHSGFSAEIEFDGQIYSYEYRKPVRRDERIPVAAIEFKDGNFRVVSSLDASFSSRECWKIKTNQFTPVSVCMFSPNYWDHNSGIGNKHYFFMLNGCVNDTTPNGFFNEFLTSELAEHKRVFEALGAQMRVETVEDQLSGVGFSSTKRNSIICKVTSSFNRVVRILF